MPGFRLEERAVDGIGRCATMAMDSGRGRAQSPSPTPTPMGILLVTKTDAVRRAPLAGASSRVFDQGDPKENRCKPDRPVERICSDQPSSRAALLPRSTAVPQSYRLAPRCTPAQCLPLNGDRTATISVPDPPAPTPTPPDGKARA
jgi:hypothetical protein